MSFDKPGIPPSPEDGDPAQPGEPATPAILERRASWGRLETLAENGFLNRAGFERALAGYISSAGRWRSFLDYSCWCWQWRLA